MIIVLFCCWLGDRLNATLWIALYLWLNVTKGLVDDVCMFCSLVTASVVLVMSEWLVKIAFLMSSSKVSAESSEGTCNIDGAIFWQINSRNDVLLNLAAASLWLNQVMHSALLVPSKIFMLFIICLLTSSFLLLLATCAMICVMASVMLADGAGDAPLNGV